MAVEYITVIKTSSESIHLEDRKRHDFHRCEQKVRYTWRVYLGKHDTTLINDGLDKIHVTKFSFTMAKQPYEYRKNRDN